MRLLLTPDQIQILRNERGDLNASAFIQGDGERLTVIAGVVLGIPTYLDANMEETTPDGPVAYYAYDHDFDEDAVALLTARAATRAIIIGDAPLEDIETSMFASWREGLSVIVDDVFEYEGALWGVIQAHTTQADWAPPLAASLWIKYRDPDVIEAWVAPTGAHDAYPLGAIVTHNGQTWISIVDANVWEPGVFGWDEM